MRRLLAVLLPLLGCAHAAKPACISTSTFSQRVLTTRFTVSDPELAAAEAEYIRTHPALLSRDDAIAIAQRFLRREGFTDEPPEVDPETIHRDIMEALSFEETMAMRRDTVDPHAVGAVRRAKYWMVVFPYTAHARELYSAGEQTGRAVLVSIDGRGVRVQHQDVSCIAAYE